MKKIILMSVMMIVAAGAAFGQNTYKIFDAVAITPSDPVFDQYGTNYNYSAAIPFGTKDVYLYCPAGAVSTLSGPYNTNLIIDNFLTINGTNALGGQNSGFSSGFGDILGQAGSPMEAAFTGVAPVDVSGLIASSGVYSFKLMDYGFSYGSTEVYLNTTCSLKAQICHRDNGAPQFKTLSVGAGAIQSHLDRHSGDYLGACTNQ